MKSAKILFWVSTTLIFLMEGLMPALTSQTEMAKEGFRSLGYPEYFGTALSAAKVLGATSLMIPAISAKIKEWAYAGLTFDFIFAAISIFAVKGMNAEVFFPIIVLAILAVSYINFHKIQAASKTA